VRLVVQDQITAGLLTALTSLGSLGSRSMLQLTCTLVRLFGHTVGIQIAQTSMEIGFDFAYDPFLWSSGQAVTLP